MGQLLIDTDVLIDYLRERPESVSYLENLAQPLLISEDMTDEISFTRFAHADTNILSMVSKDLTLWRPLQDFLHSNDLCLAISGAQAAELSEAKHLHESLNVLLTAVPSVIIKNADKVLNEEVESHPQRRTVTLLSYPLNALLRTTLSDYLSDPALAQARREQRIAAKCWIERLVNLKSNFAPTKSGKYTKEQAEEFVWLLMLPELSISHLEFLTRFKNDLANLKTNVFRSCRIMGYVTFYKYYIGKQEPKLNDFGDMFQLYDLPYCRLVIIERNMCEFLRQIKRNHDVLDGVTIMNKDLLKDWEWVEEK